MARVVNDLGNPSRPLDDQCDWLCAPSDIHSWGRFLQGTIDAGVALNNASPSDTAELAALRPWMEENKKYADLRTGSALGAKILALYGPVPTLNATVVADLARRAEDGNALYVAAGGSIPGTQQGPGGGARTPDWDVEDYAKLALLAGGLYLFSEYEFGGE